MAGALRNLSVNDKHRKVIIDHGGPRVLKEAAEKHAANEKLQAHM